MTPEERAAAAMREYYKHAAFEPRAYCHIEGVMGKAIKAAVAERTEECAKVAEDVGGSGGRTWNDAAQEIAAAIRGQP